MSRLAIISIVLAVVSVGKCANLRAAPYYMPLDNNGQGIDIAQVIQTTGVKEFILAFALAPNGGGCVPVWDGNENQRIADDTAVLAKVQDIRSQGGDVSVSFGGYNGNDLGHACPDAQSLADAYQIVIDKYDLTNVDFDVEGDDLGDVQGETKRFEALKIIRQRAQEKARDLTITLTLPCTTVGLSDLGKSEIQRAVDLGLNIDLYKIMAFDYGGPGADQVNSVISVMDQVHQQLKQLRSDLNDDQIYAATGMILMNGHTDQPSELYTLDTFRQLIDHANSKHFGRVSYWSLNRDRQCTGPTGWVDGSCSSVDQQPWDFTKILANFH